MRAQAKLDLEPIPQRADNFRLNAGAEPEFAQRVMNALNSQGIALLPPLDVENTFELMSAASFEVDTVMLDPWYNKGFGGTQDGYQDFFLNILAKAGKLSNHVYFWGFPEIVAPFVERIPAPLRLTCWLTWYYKNNPSVIRGWRSSQNACLHLSREGAAMFPQRFLNEKQLELLSAKKLRYMPGPTSVIECGPDDVIEEPLLVGFVGKNEQTGHPSQKPAKVYERLLRMTMPDNGIVLDPMAGSGTTGSVAQARSLRAILADRSEEYVQMMERRLQVKRLDMEGLGSTFPSE